MISRAKLKEFWESHPDAAGPLQSWFREATQGEWKTPSDIKAIFASASFLHDRLVVFNIAGNKYRLVVHVLFQQGILYIRFVGTHQEYDEQNKKGW